MLPNPVCFSSAKIYAIIIVRRVSMQTGSTALLLAVKNLSEDSERNVGFLKLAHLLIVNQANVEKMNEVRTRENGPAFAFGLFNEC